MHGGSASATGHIDTAGPSAMQISEPACGGPQAQLGALKQLDQQQCRLLGLPARYITLEIINKNHNSIHGGSARATGRMDTTDPSKMQTSEAACRVQHKRNQ